jgi:SagB-type dehydrogenase family enzyme
MDKDALLGRVIRYHQETKHHFFRYARALGYLDWANQPNPFRRYEGAPLLSLPILEPDEEPLPPPYKALYRAGSGPAVPITLQSISRFFEYALSLTAWKQAGETRWALRSNPSSGNLHPTEGYLIIGPVPELASSAALYHYAPKQHGLEKRAGYSTELFKRLLNGFPPQAFLVGMSSIHWREAWKYGERAFRYCQHDAGHAIGALRIAAAALGWRLVHLEGLSDETIEWLLGLNRSTDFEGAELEHPDLIAVVWPDDATQAAGIPLFLEPSAVHALVKDSLSRWQGKANRLSHDDPVPWEIIEDVAKASRKETCEHRSLPLTLVLSPAAGEREDEENSPTLDDRRTLSAWQIIHQRRSALAFDGQTSISAASFFKMMQRVVPRPEVAVAERPMPWDAIPWDPAVHLALFVHRVRDLAPGLYMLIRDPSKREELQKATDPRFVWSQPPGLPPALPLYFLEEGNAQQLAAQVSCHQAIAGEGAFSLGMIAEFDATLRRYGPWFYRHLFWETGLIGQVLYLEAEAAGVRATGIGCFFDDPVHQVLGFKDTAYQTLYHFTVGGPVDDPRLTTLPPYGEHVGGEERGMDLP